MAQAEVVLASSVARARSTIGAVAKVASVPSEFFHLEANYAYRNPTLLHLCKSEGL